ncbi:helix-turn-helix transcriptional regulator [Rivibacter subsaxonicus]|uniref:Regulatory LuxR family protein n=1 Tax=Rivibacter subsaxonicus TaxID=457575 RepID=A0A4V2FUI5_9BURK|nr:helix-turn-helix transcriptional regulator [Rivibacter subsaxonicus]RZU02116.1 regulatory LuxR family protein [Rivibacter subsaxonicus]
MNHLTRNDYAAALQLLQRLEAASTDPAAFARAVVDAIGELVPYELGTLSVCQLDSGHRDVIGLPGVRLSAADLEAFDHHFHSHPLVAAHGRQGRRETARISDCIGRADFRRTPLYADYYRRIGLEYVVAVPLHQDARTLASLVLNRSTLDFSERDFEKLELLRPHLAFLYAQACSNVQRRPAQALAPESVPQPPPAAADGAAKLTAREREVLAWLARGKTDAEIAVWLALSPRTVHKHLEHIYVKLGVETRTAAVMRGLSLRPPPAPLSACVGFASEQGK